MSFAVDPEGLRAAAGTLALLPGDIDNAPRLDAGPTSDALKSVSVGMQLAKSNDMSLRAKDAVKVRFNHFAVLLTISAETFNGTDAEAARRLAEIGDLNSGGR
ncbi:hypothetical protein IU449_22005 [Nocardia higoensis]|uniref:Uncharacterized protein n=1 Tax=Nocardia higoensis TaxID=228599 RepID=A0ABS0DFI1_9NOCA|nr:hypothetical protein [Nocardia higoensis]MBF6357184.1 hypothetical protein [Nocardia higoensis]